MSESKDTKLVWVDLETTGLDPQRDVILEIAAVITDSELNEIARYESLIEACDNQALSMYVAKMHAHNGLLAALARGAPAPETVHLECIAFVKKHAPGGLLAGSTIVFDRSFLAVHMPAMLSLLHYRSFDVSTLKAAYRMWVGDIAKLTDPAHRAMGDILGSIEECRRARAFYLSAAAPTDTEILLVQRMKAALAARASDPVRALLKEEEPREDFSHIGGSMLGS